MASGQASAVVGLEALEALLEPQEDLESLDRC